MDTSLPVNEISESKGAAINKMNYWSLPFWWSDLRPPVPKELSFIKTSAF